MNIRRIGERKNIAVFAILPTVCEGCAIFTTSQTRGLVTHESRKVTSTPGVRPTGSLRIALGERCFREPTLQAALATPLAHYVAPLGFKSASRFEICRQMRRKPT